MHADCYTHIGRQHAECQDYARTGSFVVDGLDMSELYEGIPSAYAAVSDGCSQSPDSDIGARFLIRGLENALLGQKHPSKHAIEFAHRLVVNAGYNPACLDATLLYALADKKDINVCVHGDGVVAARRRDGRVTHTVVECPGNAPDYLSYDLDEGRKATYKTRSKMYGLKTYRSYEGQEMTSEMEILPFSPVTLSFPREEYDLVVIMSDGAQSFLRNTPTGTERVPVHEVVAQVMAMKNTTGDFVVRRIRTGFLHRFCTKNGWHHYDDLAVAAIYDGDNDG